MAAQTCRNDEDTPNLLFPSSNSTGIRIPMSGPATYHGHGWAMTATIGSMVGGILPQIFAGELTLVPRPAERQPTIPPVRFTTFSKPALARTL